MDKLRATSQIRCREREVQTGTVEKKKECGVKKKRGKGQLSGKIRIPLAAAGDCVFFHRSIR